MQNRKVFLFVSWRILIGFFFTAVGISKLFEPTPNFLYLVQSYQCFPPILEQGIALIVPWIEFLLGLFLLLGLWTGQVLQGFLILIGGFILVLGQALVRGLPLDECGCFGGLISVPISKMIIFDIGLWVILSILLNNLKQTKCLGLDQLFDS